MADFDGATYLTRQLDLADDVVASSKLGTLSVWFHLDSLAGNHTLFSGFNGSPTLQVWCDVGPSPGIFRFLGAASDASTALDLRTATALSTDTVYHIAASWDLSAGTTHLLVDGSDDANEVTAVDKAIVYRTGSGSRWRIGAHALSSPTNIFDGAIYDLAFWPGVYLDLTDEDSLHLLVADDSATGRVKTDPTRVKPVGYGREGRNLAFPAAIMASGGFQGNNGIGGKFTLTGSPGEDLATGGPTSVPSPWRLFPNKETPGIRWRLDEQTGEPYPRNEMGVEHREGLTSFGKLIALENMDDTTRRERPGMNFSDLVLGNDNDDDDHMLR